MLVFYPLDFSPVCTDQLSVYQEVLPQIEEQGATLVGISVDSSWAHRAFRDKLGITIPLLSDFEPKGAMIRSYGAYLDDAGHGNRSLVLVDPDGVVSWVHESPTPLEIPGANLIFDALASADWTSGVVRSRLCDDKRQLAGRASECAHVPSLGARAHEPTAPAGRPDDHVRGEGPEAIVYLDLACPALRGRPGRGSRSCRCDSSFATSRWPASIHERRPFTRPPRPPPLRTSTASGSWWTRSIATREGSTTRICGSGRESLGLDLERFNRERRSEPVAERVRRDFESGIRAGVTGTPAAFVDGQADRRGHRGIAAHAGLSPVGDSQRHL